MPTVRELSTPCGNYMLGPRPGPGVCRVCCTFEPCWPCAHTAQWADAVVPISYSIAGEQLNHELWRYKRLRGDVARLLTVRLAAVLWRFLDGHEACVANAVRTGGFELVTTVPSGDRERDDAHPLRRIVGELVGPTRERHERLLNRSARPVSGREFSAEKFVATRPLGDQSVLLIDDTWTTGANAQSAAAALKEAGSGPVGVVVIGRHINRSWQDNDRRLRALPRAFDWDLCALERCSAR